MRPAGEGMIGDDGHKAKLWRSGYDRSDELTNQPGMSSSGHTYPHEGASRVQFEEMGPNRAVLVGAYILAQLRQRDTSRLERLQQGGERRVLSLYTSVGDILALVGSDNYLLG